MAYKNRFGDDAVSTHRRARARDYRYRPIGGRSRAVDICIIIFGKNFATPQRPARERRVYRRRTVRPRVRPYLFAVFDENLIDAVVSEIPIASRWPVHPRNLSVRITTPLTPIVCFKRKITRIT